MHQRTVREALASAVPPPRKAYARRRRPAMPIPRSTRGRILLELVRAEAAEILGHAAPSDIDSERQFLDLGFDSLAAVELRTRLAQATGLTLPATVVFDQPTVSALASYLSTELAGDAVPARVEDNPSRCRRTPCAAVWATLRSR